MGVENLTEPDQRFIIQKAAAGYNPEEIGYLFRNDYGKPIQNKTIREYLESEGAQSEIELLKQVREKKAEVTKEDLLNDLVNYKTRLEDWLEELRSGGHGKTENEAIKNAITVVDKIAELIGELDQQTSQHADNIININNVQQNITQVVQYMPKEKKQDIAEQLAEDDDIENFVIERKETV